MFSSNLVKERPFLERVNLLFEQEEQEGLKRHNADEAEMLTWQDYKAMPFTQCVSHSYCFFPRK